MSNSFDCEQFKANAIEQMKAGAPLSGKDGVLAQLLENLLNSALEGENGQLFGRRRTRIGQPPQRSHEQAGTDFDERRIQKKWPQPVQNWGQTAQQLAILFPDRFCILA